MLRLLARAVDEASDFILLTDATPPAQNGPLIEYANTAFVLATGYAQSELLGMPCVQLLASHNDPVVAASIRANTELGLASEKELLVARKDGSAFWAEYTAKPLREDDGSFKHWIVIGRDITSRRHMHGHISALMQVLDAVDQHVEIFALDGERYALAFSNAAADRETSLLTQTVLNDELVGGETPLYRSLRNGMTVRIAQDGLEMRALDASGHFVLCIKPARVLDADSARAG